MRITLIRSRIRIRMLQRVIMLRRTKAVVRCVNQPVVYSPQPVVPTQLGMLQRNTRLLQRSTLLQRNIPQWQPRNNPVASQPQLFFVLQRDIACNVAPQSVSLSTWSIPATEEIQMAIKCKINESIRELCWTAADGRAVTLHVDRASDANRAYAMLHGFKQRGSDVMALTAGSTDTAKLAELQAIVAHIESGTSEWSRRAVATPRVSANRALLIEALARMAPGKEATQRVAVEAFTNDEIAALLVRADIKRVADAIMAERSVGVDTEALMMGLI